MTDTGQDNPAAGSEQPTGSEPAPPRPNRTDINNHLYTLFPASLVQPHPDALIEIAWADPRTDGDINQSKMFSAFAPEQAGDFAERKNASGMNVYVGAALRKAGTTGRAAVKDILSGFYAWTDFDDTGDFDRVHKILQQHGLPPTHTVMTGVIPHPRFQHFFVLDCVGGATPDQLRTVNKALHELLGGDPVHSPHMVMRLAGTINYPSPRKLERGRVVELTALKMPAKPPVYTLERLAGVNSRPTGPYLVKATRSASGTKPKPPPGANGGARAGNGANGSALGAATADRKPGRSDEEILALLEASRQDGKWHNNVRAAIATMLGRGWSDSAIRMACQPYFIDGVTDKDFDDLIDGARKKWNKPDAEAEDTEIARLASLPTLAYEREAAAEAMGCRVSILDKLVKDARARLFPDQADDDKQGHAISFAEPEQWPDPVVGSELLDEIAAALKCYVVMTERARHSIALWVLHTYLLDIFMISPRLAVCSPVKRCGKTTLLDVLSCLVFKPLPTANVSPAAVFRVVEAYRPCLLIDEADTFLAASDEPRGVLNSGHRRGGKVLRTVGEDHEPRSFDTYAAVAIAIIGDLPDTLADRSVRADLQRKLANEITESFRIDRVGALTELTRKAARWAADNAERIAAIEPSMPASVHSRVADNWRPLLSIAEAAGGAWPQRARDAATQAAAATEATAQLEILLSDIKDIFAKRAANTSEEDADRIASLSLVAALVHIEGGRWAEMGKAHKPLTQNGLAKRLKPLGIAPEGIRIGEHTARGYMLVQFQEAFERYLVPAEGDSNRNNATNLDEMGTSCAFQTVTDEPDVAVGKCEKPNNDGLCNGVAVEKGDSGEARAYRGQKAGSGPPAEPPPPGEPPAIKPKKKGCKPRLPPKSRLSRRRPRGVRVHNKRKPTR
jgi:putative DNA primase/helicase